VVTPPAADDDDVELDADHARSTVAQHESEARESHVRAASARRHVER
jgi:hypothetical protein